MTPTSTILFVEGRKPAAERLAPVLNDQGYNIVTASTRREALGKAHQILPAAVVLDTPSLRFSGHHFCKALQAAGLEIPVLALLPEGAKIDRGDGARAHLRYPLSAKKLANRIARMLPVPNDEVLQVGDVILNLKQRCVVCGGRETSLTPKQVALLEILMRNPGKILTRGFLMKQVWNTDYVGDTRTLEVHVHWLRKAIETNHQEPVHLRTVRRVGYRFAAPAEEKK